MFGFKSLALILATATAVVMALPTAANSGALAARVAEPGVVVRAPVALPEPVALSPLVARGGPSTIPDCVNDYNNKVAPIFVQIDAAVEAKVSVTVLVNLWAQIVVELKALIVNIKALVDVDVDIKAGLSIDVIASLFVDLIAVIVVKLQACVSILGLLDILVFLNIFLQIEAQISACVRAIVSVCVGINVVLNVNLKANIDALVAIALQLGAVVSVIADLQALLSL